ncbi:MFS transporter [Massilia sp. IC2-477]|uniref:MFS transporter n=1 Tax=unclassified Massilia TaxID=2609279 RepID=UPI001D12DB22|nr:MULTISPECIES: MFS transporter [unclassified Massilia]MCC2955681.1 MFS transporter [Massilia sp. IC2-477]MCC2974924.1 MFS transporter [Massilia sp. IC2-476]
MQSTTTYGAAGSAPITHPTSGARNINARDGEIHPGEIAVGVVIGRASEYFEFFVYAIASVLVFPAIFFPWADRLEATLYSFIIFSFAFIVRPIGTVIFMWLQTRFSREIKLTIALLLMGTSTVVISFLPSYDRIGMAAIVILSLMRIGQGIAQGGSWDGLPSLLALSAPEHKRGFYAMLGQLAAPIGFLIAAGLFAYLLSNLSQDDFLVWGWRFPFFCAFAINIVALFARLRLVSTSEYSRLLDAHELDPAPVGELVKSQGSNIAIGALAALASYALFHLVTVFPLSWIQLYDTRPMDEFLHVQMWGAALAVLAVLASGLIADKVGRRTTLGTLAALIALFSGFVPTLMDGGETGQNIFILVGFVLLGLSYGQAAGAVTANFKQQYRYTGAALTSDLAWLVGAAFAPLVALGLSANFGLGYVSLYLLSGAVGSLAALSLNRALEIRD